jgi:hypothetical protein
MDGAKQQEIGRHPILKWYGERFSEFLLRPRSQLMVIGLGFGDLHVNEAIEKAVAQGLRLFVIDLAGAEIAFKLNKTRQRGQMIGPDSREDMLKASLAGGSARSA